MGPFWVSEVLHTGIGMDNPHPLHIIQVINWGTVLMDWLGDFWVKGEVHRGISWGNSSPHTYNSGDKFRNSFNGQAWEHFGLEVRYIQDLVGKFLTP